MFFFVHTMEVKGGKQMKVNYPFNFHILYCKPNACSIVNIEWKLD